MLKLLNHGTKRVIQKGEWFIQEDKHGDRWPLGSTEHPHSKKLISSQQVLHRREQGCVTERQTGPQDILAESPTHQNISLDSGLDSPKYPHIFWSVRELDATNRACDTLVHAQPVGDTNTPCKDEEHLRVYTVISKHWSPLSNIISLYKSKWMIVDRKDISQQGSSLILYKYFMQTGRAPRVILWTQLHTTSKPKIRLSFNKCLSYSALKSRSKQWNEAFLSMFHYFWITLLFGHTNFICFRGLSKSCPTAELFTVGLILKQKTCLWRSKKEFSCKFR